jgi:hypothetical protein
MIAPLIGVSEGARTWWHVTRAGVPWRITRELDLDGVEHWRAHFTHARTGAQIMHYRGEGKPAREHITRELDVALYEPEHLPGHYEDGLLRHELAANAERDDGWCPPLTEPEGRS